MRSAPLIFGIAMISVGWATGGGAAQILFTLFGEQVFHRGASGHRHDLGIRRRGSTDRRRPRPPDRPPSRVRAAISAAITVAYLTHGAAYVVFSAMQTYWLALLFICASRVGMAVTSVLNYSQLLKHTRDEYRGRVFATLESVRWAVMMLSMAAAGICLAVLRSAHDWVWRPESSVR